MSIYQLIIELVGYENFYEGRLQSYSSIKLNRSVIENKKYKHSYTVIDRKSVHNYIVEIINNGPDLFHVHCNCPRFKRTNACHHIAGVLLFYSNEIFSCEYIDEEEESLKILDTFIQNSQSKIKEKINIELEFDFSDNSIDFKLYIGTKKLYVLKGNKFYNFAKAYKNNQTLELGKLFTYDSNNYYFSDEDKKIIDFLTTSNQYNNYYYEYTSLSLRDFEALLNIMGNRSFKITDYGQIYETLKGLPTNYKLTYENEFYHLNIDDIENYRFFTNSQKYVAYKNNFYILEDFEIRYLNSLKSRKINALTFKKDSINKFGNGLLRKLKNNIQIADNITDISLPTILKTKLYFDILYSKLQCKLIFEYKTGDINYFEENNILRDKTYEDEVYSEMISYGFNTSNDKLVIEDEDTIYEFLEEILPSLPEKYEIFTSKKIDNTSFKKKIKTNNNFSIGQDGIMSYNFDVDGIDYEELNGLFKALKAKKKYYKFKSNDIVSLNDNDELKELNNLIEDLELTVSDIENGNAEIPKYRALYIDSLKNNKINNITTNNLFDEFIENFKKFKNIDVKFDEDDNNTLRDYQKDGVKWLTTIYKCDLGGILADEMGLGKSIQTISFIKQILKEKEDAKILTVAPTSLIYNWQKEFEKFAKDLKYVVVSENKTKRLNIFNNRDKYNIFITSYGLVRNDNDEYEQIDFEACIIDEAQAIKNYQAGMTKEIKKIKAKCKIALTGTPVENNVTELWSIFDFIMPGYLNSIMKFKEKYSIKDVEEKDLEILKKLNYQIKPFILRRKKSDVAKSLPPKVEKNIYIDLPDKQKKLYLKVLNDTKKEMDEIIANEGFQKARFAILQLLTKLRQICIDPSVLYENYKDDSIKIEHLIKVVKENIENGNKILIFSSFKRVLDHVKDEFKKQGITFYMIDGSVKSKLRMQMVESFNNDNTNCFLITLKAGGNGLNLTGANTVIHLDIWWNPQVENQASDRAHRIGQTQSVTILKLITKGTIEEKIIELQEKKKILSENLIEGKNSADTLSSLSEKEIKKLLSYSE